MQITPDDSQHRQTASGTENPAANEHDAGTVAWAAGVLRSVVETACEHEPDLDLMRLVNYIDLYRQYLDSFRPSGFAGAVDFVSRRKPVQFEQFVRDSHLLMRAAARACVESEERVKAPPPLRLSANQ